MPVKRTLLSSIFSMRCPRCREGKMFPEPLYSRRFMKTNQSCPCCGQPFLLEPGFFLGSAYFGYIINGLLLFAIAYALYFSGTEITIGAMVISIVAVIFGLLPFTLRFSKSLWIHIFVRYEGNCDEIPRK